MTASPVISVIVCAYNVEGYIAQCLQSLLISDASSYEVIVIDDGSTDKTLEIIQAFTKTHPNLRVQTRENGGLGAARNTGMGRAEGRYLSFVDGDDWVQANYIDTCLAYIRADPQADLWVFDYLNVEDGGRHRQACQPDFWGASNAAWNKVFRRDLIAGDYFDEDILYEDLSTIRPWVARARRARHIDQALYNYRNGRQGSIMSSVDMARFYELLTAACRCVQRIERDAGRQDVHPLRGRSESDWIKRFYTRDVFMPGIVDWPRKIASFQDRKDYARQFLTRLSPQQQPDKRLLARDFGFKIAVSAFCYEHHAYSTADFLLHRMGRIKRRLLQRRGRRSNTDTGIADD